MAKVQVCKVSELPPGRMRGIEVNGKAIAVANVEGKFYAINGTCHHEGGPLAEGELEGKIITCPWHGAQWDVTTGKLEWFQLPLDPEPTFKTSVEGDTVYVEA
ncbi:MAG: non-heme iron oxygenase ferredoxin subunit [Candidatus Micrarchaeota archaeon]|nr:non-heme iron oxygenase ferredoxin subunit [Candidatus Micrarchaeota archaeon]